MLKRLFDAPNDKSPNDLQRMLSAIREHLGMEVAYISEFVDDRSVFREVDAPGLEHLIKPGDSRALADVYCPHILAGRLPELIPDTSLEPIARAMPITRAIPIGAHVSVPIRSQEGAPIGMFCCLSPSPNTSLNARDLKIMRMFADLVGQQMARQIGTEREAKARLSEIERVIAEKSFSLAFQPIWDFRSFRPMGLEALCRFTGEPYRPPNEWFAEAFEIGLGVDLELAVIQHALEAFRALPEDIYLSVNASPATILSGRILDAVAGAPLNRLVIELTEHAIVEDYDDLVAALTPLRHAGIQTAIDDAGAGYAGLQHILRLHPDRIKLDMSLTRSVNSDPARRALVSAMVSFSREIRATLIAEGIETAEEFEALMSLGVPKGQGYFLGRPADLETALQRIQNPPVLRS